MQPPRLEVENIGQFGLDEIVVDLFAPILKVDRIMVKMGTKVKDINYHRSWKLEGKHVPKIKISYCTFNVGYHVDYICARLKLKTDNNLGLIWSMTDLGNDIDSVVGVSQKLRTGEILPQLDGEYTVWVSVRLSNRKGGKNYGQYRLSLEAIVADELAQYIVPVKIRNL
jgi:hypothetical protein